jgi:hypothetical protein
MKKIAQLSLVSKHRWTLLLLKVSQCYFETLQKKDKCASAYFEHSRNPDDCDLKLKALVLAN